MSEEVAALIVSMRKHVMDRSGPAKDDDGNIVLPNGAWAMMLKAVDMLERQAAQLAALRAAADGWRRRAEEAEATLDARSVGYAQAVEATRSEIRRQALEEAARTIERLPYGTVATKTTSSVVPTINADYAAAVIRALADKEEIPDD